MRIALLLIVSEQELRQQHWQKIHAPFRPLKTKTLHYVSSIAICFIHGLKQILTVMTFFLPLKPGLK